MTSADVIYLALIGVVLAVVFAVLRLRERRYFAVVDGSNVMWWVADQPRLETVVAVLALLEDAGLTPIVWFDANVGYKLSQRYMGPEHLARALHLPKSRVQVAPKGTPADALLLAQARRLNAPVVSNDRFRDWQGKFPELSDAAHMIRGRVQGETIELDVRVGLTSK